jgi:hypothetical protein
MLFSQVEQATQAWAGGKAMYLSISARMTSMTSSGRRAMFLWPRSIVIPGCAVVEVLAGVLKGRLGQGHDLVVRDGRGRVVAHDERARIVRGGCRRDVAVAYML